MTNTKLIIIIVYICIDILLCISEFIEHNTVLISSFLANRLEGEKKYRWNTLKLLYTKFKKPVTIF